MTKDKQTKDVITQVLESKDLGLSDVARIAVEHELTVRDVKHVLKMLDFFHYKYLDNTIDWFRAARFAESYELQNSIYSMYNILGISITDIQNSKHYVSDSWSNLGLVLMKFPLRVDNPELLNFLVADTCLIID